MVIPPSKITSKDRHPVVRPWHPNAAFVLKFLMKTSSDEKGWITLQELESLAVRDLPDILQRAIKDGLITRETQVDANGQSVDGVRLNLRNPVVEAVKRVLKWVPDRISYCRNQKGMPYIDSAFLSRGFTMDRNFQSWRVGQTRSEADGWLDLLAQAGVIVKKVQPHKTDPGHKISTWWLHEEAEAQPERPADPWPTSKPTAPHNEERNADDHKPNNGPVSVWQHLLGSPA